VLKGFGKIVGIAKGEGCGGVGVCGVVISYLFFWLNGGGNTSLKG